MSILLDTSILVAYANADDPRHGDAREVMEAVLRGELGDAFTSDYILAEAFNFIRQRIKDETVARTLDGDIFGRPGARPVVRDVFRVHGAVFAAARIGYLAHWGGGLSFTDWTTLELVRARELGAVATFDRGFAPWVRVVPAPPTSSSARRSRSGSGR